MRLTVDGRREAKEDIVDNCKKSGIDRKHQVRYKDEVTSDDMFTMRQSKGASESKNAILAAVVCFGSFITKRISITSTCNVSSQSMY